MKRYSRKLLIFKTQSVFLLSVLSFSAGLAVAQVSAAPPMPASIPARVPGNGITFVPGGQIRGSVVPDQPGASIALSLDEAIQRGLKNNLGVLERETSNRLVRADRIRALSALLPTLGIGVAENIQQTNLAVFGFRFPGIPGMIGPFNYYDLRASGGVSVYDRTARKNLLVAEQNIKAVDLSLQDARDLIVQAVANAYLTIISDAARVEATKAQVATALALFDRAKDQHAAGVSPAIDELRAQVELQSRQQQLLAQQNAWAKDKLALARVIGLAGGQDFTLTDSAPYVPLEALTPEQTLQKALDVRADLKSARMQLQAAELSRQAALAQKYPTMSVAANYGVNGVNPAQSHGSFGVTGAIRMDVFDGGRVKADVLQADAIIQQRKDEIADLQGRIDIEIRTALLDLKSAADQVTVARSNLDLANQTLTQARDRFAAGVTDNIEVVQAQESVAAAQENLISSLYAHNLGKVALARAMGMTEMNLKQFMGGK
jgi:outer membrane protein TolC